MQDVIYFCGHSRQPTSHSPVAQLARLGDDAAPKVLRRVRVVGRVLSEANDVEQRTHEVQHVTLEKVKIQ